MDRASKINKYETVAKIIKMYSKTKASIEEIAAALYQADYERQTLQDTQMKQNRRQTRMPSHLGDVQRILDIHK